MLAEANALPRDLIVEKDRGIGIDPSRMNGRYVEATLGRADDVQSAVAT